MIVLSCWLAVFSARDRLRAEEPGAPPQAAVEIIGYLPGYRFESFDYEQAELVSDVVLFSVEPRPDASLDETRLPEARIQSAVTRIRQRGARVQVTVGGWGESAAFPAVTADKTLRLRLARNVADYCEQHGFDGVDINWEHPTNHEERQNLGRFLANLKSALQPSQRQISLAVTAGDTFDSQTLASVDRFHLMAYDNGGRHSTLAQARSAIQSLRDHEVPADKICLGMPFYGRPFRGPFGAATTYRDIVQRYQPALEDDEVAGIYFNGPETVAAKVHLARQLGLAGVMIWELGQDVSDADRSLLQAIHRASRSP
ncbi:MAG: glycosyl hydrolase family 18 protein [Planctomycetaceae bacterium]